MAAKKTDRNRNPAQGASRVTRATPAKSIGASPGPKAAAAKVAAQRTAKPGQQAGGVTKAAGKTTSTPKPGRAARDAASSKTGRSLFDRAETGRRRSART